MANAELRGLRVAFLAGTLGQGGAERQLYYMIRALLLGGGEPQVLSLTAGEHWEPHIRRLGVTITDVGVSSTRWQRVRRITGELSKTRPHVVQSQHFFANLYAAASGRMCGIPSIGAIRSDAFSEVRGMVRPLGYLSLRAPTVLAANSRRGYKNAIALGAKERAIAFLPNVVDTQDFRVRSEPRRGAVRILAVGRLVRVKRLDRFIRLIAFLHRDACLDIEGVIVGSGPERAELESMASTLRLRAPVLTFHEATEDVSSLYRGADLLVLTSDWEGTPNVVLEAMASGLPVVSTDVGGVSAVLPDGECGYIVSVDDENGLAAAAQRIVCDAPLREKLGAAARRHVELHFSLDRLTDALGELYGRVVNAAQRRPR